jgi:predicted enzyme related to lactoylglutathione lyase
MSFDRRELIHLLTFAAGSGIAGLGSPLAQAAEGVTSAETGQTTEKVLGIGGLFFRAKDPDSLGRWYKDHLGINLTPSSYEDKPWRTEAGVTIFSPFPEASHYFGDPKQMWMVNFRVRDLDKMATQLKAAGIAVDIDPKVYPNGRFARIHDPEGNPIELWQPAG